MHAETPVIIVDPVMLFREGLRRILSEANFQPVWCGDCAPVGPIPLLSNHASPLLIIGTEIEEALVQIVQVKRYYPTTRVVLLMDLIASRHQVMAALRCGANTLVFRRSSCEMLIGTLKLVVEGAAVFPADLLDGLLRSDIPPPAPVSFSVPSRMAEPEPGSGAPLDGFGLSERELTVLRRLLDGLPNKEIARRLGITEATVKVHVKAILRKAGMRNRTQVAMWAFRVGFGATTLECAAAE